MKAIVTTTIHEPTDALKKFSDMTDWKLYVVGDKNAPNTYQNLNAKYLSPEYQEEQFPEVSGLIGWNCIQRRNIGFLEAYRDGAEIVATVDDDNIPYETWGQNLLVGQEVEIDCYENKEGFFDPLSLTSLHRMWHRGYPIQKVPTRHLNQHKGRIKTKILIEASLWDGDPDVDAMCRLQAGCNIQEKITGPFPYTTNSLTVFNSQNTFIHRSVLPYYCVMAHADRMDDIWGGIILQQFMGRNFIAFTAPTVYQDRNYHCIVRDLERELMGHYQTEAIAQKQQELPYNCQKFYEAYQKAFTTIA